MTFKPTDTFRKGCLARLDAAVVGLNSPFLGDNLESMCKKNTEAHTGDIKNPLCNNKSHWEEEVGRRNKRQDSQREGLWKSTRLRFSFMVVVSQGKRATICLHNSSIS